VEVIFEKMNRGAAVVAHLQAMGALGGSLEAHLGGPGEVPEVQVGGLAVPPEALEGVPGGAGPEDRVMNLLEAIVRVTLLEENGSAALLLALFRMMEDPNSGLVVR
jgi:hypothetical protein